MRVLLVDDHPLFRAGLRGVLRAADIDVIGEVGTATEAIRLAGELGPDLVVMDLHLPDGSGIDAITSISQEFPRIRILVITMAERADSVLAAMRAGASGYLLKGAGHDEITQAVYTVAAGGVVFSAPIAAQLTRESLVSAGRPQPTAFPLLTAREREVLDLMARGHNNRRIAHELVLAEKTVRNNISNLFAKLQVTTRAEAIVKAREAGLGR